MNIENLDFKVNGNTYTIKFPTVGEYRAIETMKQTLSANNYSSMSRSMMVTANEALDIIDLEAYLTVLCPKLIEDLKCDSFSQLGLLDYKELRDAFKKQFLPWWNDIEKLLRPEPINQEKKDEEAESH